MTCNLKITQWNIRGYFNNLENLQIFIFEHNPDVIIFNGSWLKNTDKIMIKGFKIFRTDRNDVYPEIISCIKNNLKLKSLENIS